MHNVPLVKWKEHQYYSYVYNPIELIASTQPQPAAEDWPLSKFPPQNLVPNSEL